jgi:putative transposase
MKEMRHGHLSITRLAVHLVWATKYRYHVLKGDIKVRCRDLLAQICDTEDVRILSGVVSRDHMHMHIEYPPKLALSDLIKRLRNRTRAGASSGVSKFEEALLGQSFLGKRIRRVESGKYH